MLSTRGLMVHTGEGWELVCNPYLGINDFEGPYFEVLAGDVLVMATSAGLLRSADEGCTWSVISPFSGLAVRGLVRDPSDPSALVVTTNQSGFDNGVFRSTDAGLSWQRVSRYPAQHMYGELAAATGGGGPLVTSGLFFDLQTLTFRDFGARSEDGGAGWMRDEGPMLPDDVDLVPLAVEAPPGTRYLARAVDGRIEQPADRLLAFDSAQATWAGGDAGATGDASADAAPPLASTTGGFTSLLETPKLLAAAFDARGGGAWAGAEQGLWRSTGPGATFDRVASGVTAISCISLRGAELHVCGHFDTGFSGVGTSTDSAASFEPLLDFREVRSLRRCGADSELAISCASSWEDWTREILTAADASASDSGAADAGATLDASAPGPAPNGNDAAATIGNTDAGSAPRNSGDGSSCGCSVPRTTGAGSSAWLVATWGLLLGRRRRCTLRAPKGAERRRR